MAAKKAKKTAAKKASAGTEALEFTRKFLKKKPTASYADVRDAADKKKIKLYPIVYGRAKALEGLVKVSPYGSKKNAAAAGPKRGPGRPKGSKNKRGPGRPRKAPAAGMDSIEGLVSTLKTLQQERDDALAAIDKIRDLINNL